jgi:hypothetical protein
MALDKPPAVTSSSEAWLGKQAPVSQARRHARNLIAWGLLLGGFALVVYSGISGDYRNETWTQISFSGIAFAIVGFIMLLKQAIDA